MKKPTTLRELDERRKIIHNKGVCKCCDNWNEISIAYSTELLQKIESMKNVQIILAEQWTGIELGRETRHTINPHQEKIEILDQVINLINQNK